MPSEKFSSKQSDKRRRNLESVQMAELSPMLVGTQAGLIMPNDSIPQGGGVSEDIQTQRVTITTLIDSTKSFAASITAPRIVFYKRFALD